MRILQIRGRNLASLAGEFTVDLDRGPLGGAGLFSIVGPTGAGKSTLLDAMCLALFDQTPRLYRRAPIPIGPASVEEEDRLSAGDARSLLTRGAISGFAEVTFVGRDGRRYRARWSARRARDRADGKLQQQVMTLADLDRDQHIGENKRATLEAIRDRLGLSFEQFCRSALLAQGEFAVFLKASGADRAELLERMTGTAIYARLSIAAHERASRERETLADLERQQAALPLLDAGERAVLEEQLGLLGPQAERARAAQRVAEAVVAWHARAGELKMAEAAAKRAGDDAGRRWRAAVAAIRWGAGAAAERRTLAATRVGQAEAALASAAQAAATAAPEGLREEREDAAARRIALTGLAGIIELAGRAHLAGTRAQAEIARCAGESEAALARARAAAVALAKVAPALAEAERSLAQARAAQDLAGHRSELQDGEPCPLCGSPAHPWAEGSPLVPLIAGFQRRVDDLKGKQKTHERAEASANAAAAELARSGEAAAREAKAAASAIGDAQQRWAAAGGESLLISPARIGIGPLAEGVGERVRAAIAAVEARLTEIAAAEREAERLRRVAEEARRALEGARVALDAADRVARAIDTDLARVGADLSAAADVIEPPLGSRGGEPVAVDDAWLATKRRELDAARAALDSAVAVLTERRERLAAHLAAAPQRPRRADAAHDVDAARDADAARVALAEAARAAGEVERAYHEVRVRLETDERLRSRGAELGPRIEAQRGVQEKWQALADLIGSHDGKKLRVFAQSLTLEALIAQANRHLEELARRYQLMRVPGQDLELQIVDREMGDEVRSVHSLSGGESFLVSLALALALSSLSQHAGAASGAGDTRVETLFIDEGFGTLDPDTLEIALGALDALQATGRQIGVISHVPGLAERIGAMVRVEPCGGGRSRVVVAYQPSTIVPRQAASNAGTAAEISRSSVARQ